MKKVTTILLFVAVFIFIAGNFILDHLEIKRLREEIQYEKIIQTYEKSLWSETNRHPVDSIHRSYDTIFFFKEGEFLGSVIATIKVE